MFDIQELAKKKHFKIYHKELFDLAITHPSYNADAKTKHHDYERLEFMGDAVLGFVSADLIFKKHGKLDQGDMTKLRSKLVCSSALANYSKKINLAYYIKTGHSISPDKINQSNKILEDVFEALIGAIYLDNGIKVAYRYIASFLAKDIAKADLTSLTDAKTRLQEEMQAEHRNSVTYKLLKTYGPPHNRTFIVNVFFNDLLLAEGEGKSKKAAEEDAAKNALAKRSV